mmetsp:Transcript_77701/g.225474  ORF Transcript_77701/g.225474 Transcript_77701/m.225474 type:complete len:205 (-) Transcript_77701:306-920(-)
MQVVAFSSQICMWSFLHLKDDGCWKVAIGFKSDFGTLLPSWFEGNFKNLFASLPRNFSFLGRSLRQILQGAPQWLGKCLGCTATATAKACPSSRSELRSTATWTMSEKRVLGLSTTTTTHHPPKNFGKINMSGTSPSAWPSKRKGLRSKSIATPSTRRRGKESFKWIATSSRRKACTSRKATRPSIFYASFSISIIYVPFALVG